ncbi:MAG: glycosyltransferase family 4 protein [Promethearchaeota archaeon]
MQKNIILISENISLPFDEGLKNIIYHLIKNLKPKIRIHILAKKRDNTNELADEKISLNKLFLNNKLRLFLKKISPEVVLYIPEASCTINSFIRAKILKLMHRSSKVVMLAAQHRKYLIYLKAFLSLLRPDLLLLLGESDRAFFEKKKIKVRILPPAVDIEKFHKVTNKTKVILRRKYNIPIDKFIALHVGHINRNRNIECLVDVQKIDNIQVIIVGSTTTKVEKELKYRLENQGIIIINNYIYSIQEVYQLSNIYIFPVMKQNAAIEMPLSVLEAMACNLPVITTRFGGLVDYFKEDPGFRYFESTEKLVKLIKTFDIREVHNDEKIKSFTWDNFASQIISACKIL